MKTIVLLMVLVSIVVAEDAETLVINQLFKNLGSLGKWIVLGFYLNNLINHFPHRLSFRWDWLYKNILFVSWNQKKEHYQNIIGWICQLNLWLVDSLIPYHMIDKKLKHDPKSIWFHETHSMFLYNQSHLNDNL